MPYQKTSATHLAHAFSMRHLAKRSKMVASLSIRPLRVGFVIEPEDEETIHKIIRINSVLWGGQLNPIIPFYDARPRWWHEYHQLNKPAPEEIFQAYLETFEPDILVTLDPGIAKRLPVGSTPIQRHFAKDLSDPKLYGITADRFYLSVYKEISGLPPKIRPRLLLPKPGNKKYQLLLAATYGQFPANWHVFEEQCREFFEVHEPSIPSDGCAYTRTNDASLLKLSLHRLSMRIKRRNIVLALNGSLADDILDFWNLRALGWDIHPYDTRWNLSGAELMKQYADNAKEVHIMRSRRTPDATMDAIFGGIRKSVKKYGERYPRFLTEWERGADESKRITVSAGNFRQTVSADTGEVKFDFLKPEIDLTGTSLATTDWVATLRIEGAVPEHLLASVMPYGFSPKSSELSSSLLAQPRFTSEGLMMPCRESMRSLHLQLPDAFESLKRHFEQQKYEVELSPGAINARELVNAVGGVDSLDAYLKPEVINLFESLSKGVWLNRSDLCGRLNKIFKSKDGGSRLIATYLQHRALRVGLELVCRFCRHANWFELADLDDNLHCPRCLRQFPFPAEQPPGPAAWCYRSAGCFALSGFAAGAFTVALLARFLLRNCEASGTWFPGMRLRSGTDWKEIDLAMIWQDLDKYPPRMIMAECKTFGAFDDDDFKRAAWIHKQFPDAVIVFATLRRALEKREIERLRAICNLKRQRWRHDDNRLGVLILTGHELFSVAPPPQCWNGATSDYAFVTAQFGDVMNLSLMDRLCDISQQVHLGLPRFHDYIDDFNKKRRLGRRKAGPA